MSLGAATLPALLLSLLAQQPVSAAVVIDPGTAGETFTSRSYDVTSGVRSAGVTNANASLVVLDFIFSELKALRVNGDGLAMTAELETNWQSNPSGLGQGFTLLFGSADLVAWVFEGSGFIGDPSPNLDRPPTLGGPPHFFDITGSVATSSFPSYLIDFDGLKFSFRLPNSTFLGFNATVPEEQLVLTSATLTLSSVGRPTGVPGIFAFSEYQVVNVPEPSATAFTGLALLSLSKIRRRRRAG